MSDYARYAATREHAGVRRICPACSQALIRVARQPIDRLASLFSPVQRYRCRQYDCQWEGTLHVGGQASGVPTPPRNDRAGDCRLDQLRA